MKTFNAVLAIAVTVSIASCKMNNEETQPNLSNRIVGTYKGTLTSSLSLDVMPATTEITSLNDDNIQVHCYNADIDSTFTLGLYPDGNMMRVCFTGSDFMNQYGHNMSSYNQMMGNNKMMGSMSNGTSWQQHMGTQHKSGDEHYGYFDMNANSFSYTFKFTNTPTGYTMHFFGKR